MRGILACWLSQADKVEDFKHTQNVSAALHSKFHLETGEEILSCDEYPHLQVWSLEKINYVQLCNANDNITVLFLARLCGSVPNISRSNDSVWTTGIKKSKVYFLVYVDVFLRNVVGDLDHFHHWWSEFCSKLGVLRRASVSHCWLWNVGKR